ncbi:MAG: putative Zn finger protein [Porticoccaceae bacterium]|jgi:uncharacterized Zn finger protein
MSWGYEYREYVPVGVRKSQASQEAEKQADEQGRSVQPVKIKGRKIATTFWGKAWCDHLESYSDYSNRLPRGRTYARNGSVVDLAISAGRVDAIVAGSDVYTIRIQIDSLQAVRWKKLRKDCSASIDSLLDLLGGRFSDGVMQRLTDRSKGLFPSPKEISMDCSCPDWAGLCKHLAAVLYGVGASLDAHPELLFLLRDVDHTELVSEAVSEGNLSTAFGEPSTALAGEDLGAMFGIDLDVSAETASTPAAAKKRKRTSKKKATVRKSTSKKATSGKSAAKKDSSKKVAKKSAAKKAVKKKPVKKKKVAKKPVARKKAVRKKAAIKTSVKKAAKKKVDRPGAAKKKPAKKRDVQSK